MKVVFFDASALVKRYTPEEGSDIVNALFAFAPKPTLCCLLIGALEVIFILTRKRNDGRLPVEIFQQAMSEFRAEILDNPESKIVSTTDALAFRAISYIERFNLNATDALVLRAALDVNSSLAADDQLSFWSSDKRLLRAAVAEGLATFDPEQDTLERLRELLDA
jgi:predicted nucleic acid-binding protein